MTSEILKVKKRFNYPPDLEDTPLVNFFNLRNSKQNINGVDMCYADQEPRRAKKAIFKLCKVQCIVCNKYVTKKKEILGFFLFFSQKIKTHYQIFAKN